MPGLGRDLSFPVLLLLLGSAPLHVSWLFQGVRGESGPPGPAGAPVSWCRSTGRPNLCCARISPSLSMHPRSPLHDRPLWRRNLGNPWLRLALGKALGALCLPQPCCRGCDKSSRHLGASTSLTPPLPSLLGDVGSEGRDGLPGPCRAGGEGFGFLWAPSSPKRGTGQPDEENRALAELTVLWLDLGGHQQLR